MAAVEGRVADAPFDRLLEWEQFWAKSINASRGSGATSFDRAMFVMITTILILQGNLEHALAKIDDLERKQAGMAKALASLVAGD